MKNKAPKTLDLHGCKTDEVFDKVDQFIHKNSHGNDKRLRIIPGKGTGKVKAVLLDYLKKAGYPWEYEKMDNGKQNPGALIIFMD